MNKLKLSVLIAASMMVMACGSGGGDGGAGTAKTPDVQKLIYQIVLKVKLQLIRLMEYCLVKIMNLHFTEFGEMMRKIKESSVFKEPVQPIFPLRVLQPIKAMLFGSVVMIKNLHKVE